VPAVNSHEWCPSALRIASFGIPRRNMIDAHEWRSGPTDHPRPLTGGMDDAVQVGPVKRTSRRVREHKRVVGCLREQRPELPRNPRRQRHLPDRVRPRLTMLRRLAAMGGTPPEDPPPDEIAPGGMESEEKVGEPTILRLANREWLFEGYRRALSRFREAADRHDEAKETFIPLFETLSWAVTITFFLQDRGIALDPHLDGLRWVRNRVHHQWADALELAPFFLGPMVAAGKSRINPGPFYHWVWRQPEELPPGDRPDPKGEQAYRNLLARRQARQALDAIEQFLDSLG
jgi:hypothetical protein